MSELDVRKRVEALLAEQGLERDMVEALAGQLLWRVGRTADDAPVTVRIGYATDAEAFAELPRLRGASDAEIEAALEEGTVRVEWVGQLRHR